MVAFRGAKSLIIFGSQSKVKSWLDFIKVFIMMAQNGDDFLGVNTIIIKFILKKDSGCTYKQFHVICIPQTAICDFYDISNADLE